MLLLFFASFRELPELQHRIIAYEVLNVPPALWDCSGLQRSPGY